MVIFNWYAQYKYVQIVELIVELIIFLIDGKRFDLLDLIVLLHR